MMDVPGATAASLVASARDEYVAAGTVYQVRNVVIASESAVAAGVASALGVGGLLGPLPVFSSLAVPIAEGIRD